MIKKGYIKDWNTPLKIHDTQSTNNKVGKESDSLNAAQSEYSKDPTQNWNNKVDGYHENTLEDYRKGV